VAHRGRAVLAMNCVLASAESWRSGPLNSIVRPQQQAPVVSATLVK
jgi:hypothetical protein